MRREAKCFGPGLSDGSGSDFDRSMCGDEHNRSWPFWMRAICVLGPVLARFQALR